jgi:hypothetical protein
MTQYSLTRTAPQPPSLLKRLRKPTRKLLREEPVAVTALIQAVIGVGIAFSWWHWSPEQTGAVLAVAAGTFTMARGMVIPIAKQPTVRPAPVAQPALTTNG